MKTIRTVLQDNHSGEAGWEGALVTFAIPDEIFDQMTQCNGPVILDGSFVYDIWDNDAIPLLDDTSPCDAVIEVFVSTEPFDDELAEYPWEHLNMRDEIRLNAQTWEICDQSGNSAPFFHCE